MSRIQTLFIALIFLLNSPHLYAEERISISSFFTKAEKEAVLKGEIITKCFLKNKGIVHTSNADAKINIPLTQYTGEDLQAYEMLSIEKAFFHYELAEKSGISLYNILAAFSKLSGMQYYSVTDKKVQPFIINCYRIDSAEHKRPVKDTVYSAIASKTVNYFKITDNRFGDLIFRSELYNEGEDFILKNVCIEPMEKYFIAINKKEEYRLISFFIYDKKFKGYFYCSINAMRIRSPNLLKLGMLSAESFGNRIRGSTVRMAALLGADWRDRVKAFE